MAHNALPHYGDFRRRREMATPKGVHHERLNDDDFAPESIRDSVEDALTRCEIDIEDLVPYDAE
jgi:hypothetical protein